MTKRMLIDASHAEETRVVVLDGNRLEDFDVETATKRQLKGNIYLAKVVRVEPSLQAAFVEYGGNRHGFLAFGEIHPDYYQIPVADRQRLIAAQEAEAAEDDEEDEAATADGPYVPREPPGHGGGSDDDASSATELAGPVAGGPASDHASHDHAGSGHASSEDDAPSAAELMEPAAALPLAMERDVVSAPLADPVPSGVTTAPAAAPDLAVPAADAPGLFPQSPEPAAEGESETASNAGADMEPEAREPVPADEDGPGEAGHGDMSHGDMSHGEDQAAPESLGGETEPRERRTPRFLRNYKIQEVIRRRQILLVQVVKEERGGKGAALTTYISLAGRYSVLMPNSPRGGGISRKITSAADRRRLKEVTQELQLPRGMGMIVRTAGAARPKAEILRDGEYLLNQWDQIRELTLKSVAPALIYEEANLIKRTIRDVYSRDVDEVIVDGEGGWRHARDFMRMLMPAHARKVQLWREGQPLFARMQVEAQLDGMLQPTVQLRSGGYLVINQTEALVAIDVNSGRSTRERGIEETALRTNMEAAAEVARQLRLRDLAGLIVIDFIDMEQRRHNAMVERELKDALRQDRARIQVGSISHFGLLEMSRQRLRPSLAETAFVPCPSCGGTGHVRGTESAALYVLRAVEEEGAKRKAAEIVVHVSGAIAMYVLNHKRVRLGEIEARYGMAVSFAADETLRAPEVRIERVRTQTAPDGPLPVSPGMAPDPRFAAIDAADALLEEAPDEADEDEAGKDEPARDVKAGHRAARDESEAREASGTDESVGEAARRGRRRRRRGGRRDDVAGAASGEAPAEGEAVEAAAEAPAGPVDASAGQVTDAEGAEPGTAETGEAGKRRGRRGGRRRRREPLTTVEGAAPEPDEAPAPAVPAWTGPTPADPFGGASFDIFDVMEMAEAGQFAAPPAPAVTAEAVSPPDGPGEPPTPEAMALAASEPVTSEPAGQSFLPDLEPPVTLPTEPSAPDTDLPVEDPLPWTTPDVAPPAEPELADPAPVPAAPVSEELPPSEPAAEREPELSLAPEEPSEPVAKRRGWWSRR